MVLTEAQIQLIANYLYAAYGVVDHALAKDNPRACSAVYQQIEHIERILKLI